MSRHPNLIVSVVSAVSFAAALLAVAAAGAPVAMAQQASAKPDKARGQAIASQVCAACHAADGNSPSAANPRLAGQIPEYLAKQLADFKANKERKSPVMQGFAATLSAADMANVAAYYGGQSAKPGVARNSATVELGRKLWRGGDNARGIAACASCHGAGGMGVPAQYPRLAGQYAEYTQTQLKAFRAGERTNDPNNMMRAVAARMNDRDIAAVSDYIAGLK